MPTEDPKSPPAPAKETAPSDPKEPIFKDLASI